jgi:hypothetical protein
MQELFDAKFKRLEEELKARNIQIEFMKKFTNMERQET